ncbi:LCP family protein [Nocardiopsis sp. HNM0947]|uniref:LCP family protein n=1 Tax=Nocardiopsis coralli TaxID=2772213 RepID=A0ABR9P3I4_9ACTN|nr:LCP family protein [Nocardiopsis coralli]MBE2998398.1 LCP family protein [Nocardiopsis coralli]
MLEERSARGASRLSTLQWIACAATALAVIVSLAGYGWYQGLVGNVTTTEVDTDEWGERPVDVDGIMNLLVLGSDVRTGDNADYGDAEGERADTMLIASIDVDSGAATLVNLPRDLVVDLPGCDPGDGYEGMSPQEGMISSAMTFGGVGCQWRAVEEVTGVHLDHFVMMDFIGFKDMVDALGGVEMCVPEPVDDPKAQLELDAGLQVLDGEDSLGFVRSRYAQGDGSDLSRIDRQQEFMGAMLREALSSEVMRNPATVTEFLGAVTDSITTDDDLSVDTMADIAVSLREIDLDQVQFVTVPTEAHPENENRLAMGPEAPELFAAINEGADLTADQEDEAPDGDGSVDPSDVSVEIVNNTDIDGLASEVEAFLTGEGYEVTGTGNPEERAPEATTVFHGPGEEAAAELLAGSLENTPQTEEADGLEGTLELVTGVDWDGFAERSDPGSDLSVTEDLDGVTAEDEEEGAC